MDPKQQRKVIRRKARIAKRNKGAAPDQRIERGTPRPKAKG